jgi:hypothetical protein
MATLGLMPEGKAGRPIAMRVRGAMGLLGRQLALLLTQMVIIGVGGWILAVTGG